MLGLRGSAPEVLFRFYSVIEEATRSTRRGAWMALAAQYAGDDKWLKLLKAYKF